MANKSYPIATATTTISDIANALINKYGAGVTIHYNASAGMVFSCAALSNKVIKILYSSSRFSFYYGDAWTSTTTITNQVQFQNNADGISTQIQLILGDNFFLLNALAGSYTCLSIIAKLTNDAYIVQGLTSFNNTSSYGACIGKNTSYNSDIMLLTFAGDFKDANSKLYKQNVIIRKSTGQVEANTDGSIATINGLSTVSAATSATSMIVASNAFFTSCNLIMINGVKVLPTCLYAEF